MPAGPTFWPTPKGELPRYAVFVHAMEHVFAGINSFCSTEWLLDPAREKLEGLRKDLAPLDFPFQVIKSIQHSPVW